MRTRSGYSFWRVACLAIAIGSAAAVGRSAPTAEPARTLDTFLPAEGVRAVLQVPDAPNAWKALDEAGLADAMLPAFRGAFGALEWALVAVRPETPPDDAASGLQNGETARPAARKGAAARAGLLCLGGVADAERLRASLPAFERAVAETLGGANRAVGRTEEAIGDVTVVVFSNGEDTAGHLLSGRLGVWASCNDASLLRATARKIAQGAQAASTPASRPLSDALAAAGRLNKRTAAGFHFLLSLPAHDAKAGEGAEITDLLRGLLGARADGPVVVGVAVEKRLLRAEALAAGAAPPSGAVSLATVLSLGDPCADPGGALAQWGTVGLDLERLRRTLSAQVDAALAAMPPSSPAGLTPASDLARTRLSTARETLADAQRWPIELGPEAWVVLNRFDFERAGELPTAELMATVRTRDEAATRARLAQVESRLLAAIAPSPGVVPSDTGAAHFAQRSELSGNAGPTSVTLRWLEAPALPVTLRPAWAVRDGWLYVALSPDSLAAGMRRVAAAPPSQSPPAGTARALVDGLGLRRPTSALTARPERSPALASLVRVLAPQVQEPWLKELLVAAADRWSRAESLVVAREATPDGVRTAARLTLSSNAAPVATAPPAEGPQP